MFAMFSRAFNSFLGAFFSKGNPLGQSLDKKNLPGIIVTNAASNEDTSTSEEEEKDEFDEDWVLMPADDTWVWVGPEKDGKVQIFETKIVCKAGI